MMNYRGRKKARNFFYKMIAVGSFGFLGSFIYVLSIVKMSDMEAIGYGCEYSTSGIMIRLVVGMCLMGLSLGMARFGSYGFEIQDRWVKFYRRNRAK